MPARPRTTVFAALALVATTLFAPTAQAQTCDTMDDALVNWQPCPAEPNLSLANPPISGGAAGDLFLQLTDYFGDSRVCSTPAGVFSGDMFDGTDCASFCFDVRVIGADSGNPYTNLGVTFFGANGTRIHLNPVQGISRDGGSNPGWHRLCAPILRLQPGDALPDGGTAAFSAVFGQNSPLPVADQWQAFNDLFSDVQSVAVSGDLPGVGEIVGFDNLCRGRQGCPTMELTPEDVTLTKTCEAPVAHHHNNTLGQRWECRVDVSVPATPFAGSVTLNDLFTNTSLVSSQILLGQSLSGNGNCLQGDCMIEGANFDASGTEAFQFDIFVEAVEAADVYHLENCASGALVSETGTLEPIAQSCAATQWTPRAEVVKTCDPIAEDATAPYRLNCQIEVTTNNLAGGSYVTVTDAFVAQPPSVATIAAPFMNVTSSEPWSCIDGPINQPASLGFCELSAMDLQNAGGSSTLDVSVTFDVDQAPTQVANCRFIDINASSMIDAMSKQRSALKSPIADGWPQMPDGCVYVDVPSSSLPVKLEKVALGKSCEAPVQATYQGIQGHEWACRAEVTVIPTPFNGTFSFLDTTTISSGTAFFTGATGADCTGLTTPQLQCEIDGPTMTITPHVVDYTLFTPAGATNEPVKWENCIEGLAATPGSEEDAGGNCVQTTIKPGIVIKEPPKEIELKKSCEDPAIEEQDGVTGLGWDCRITVAASPAPFSGSFTFTEDASAVSGSPNAQILSVLQQSPAWICAPGLPAQATECTINGANFDPSGVETLDFHLFAETGDKPITWRNCVNGVYLGKGDKPHEVSGNCEETSWIPTGGGSDDKETAFDIQKTCNATGARQQLSNTGWFQVYSCTITVTTNGVPFSHPLLVGDEMSYGPHNGDQFLGTPSSADNWGCVQSPYVPLGQAGAHPWCWIAGADFPHATGSSTIHFDMTLMGAAADQFGATNCANLHLEMPTEGNLQPPHEQSCVEIVAPPASQEPTLGLTKTCEAAVQIGAQWSAQCSVTIMGSGLQPGQQLRVTDELSGNGTTTVSAGNFDSGPLVGNNCGGVMVAGVQVTSCDLTTDDLIANGGSITLPYTAILGSSGGLAKPPAQNCAFVDIPGAGLHAPGGASDKACVSVPLPLSVIDGGTIGTGVIYDNVFNPVDPPLPDGPVPGVGSVFDQVPSVPMPAEPSLFGDKTCDPAISQGGGVWLLSCQITVTGSNLPGGEYVSVEDSIRQNAGIDILSSSLTAGPGTLCSSPNKCFVLPSVMGNGATGPSGATYTLDYTATLLVPGEQAAENCVRAGILHNGSWLSTTYPGPDSEPFGYCVPIVFDQPTGGDTASGPNAGDTDSCSLDTLFIIDRSGSMAQNNRMHLTRQAVFSALQIFEGGNSRSGAIMFGMNAYPIGGTSLLLPSPALESAIQSIGPHGATNWKGALREAALAVSTLPEKPLVLFISDGEPNLSQPHAVPPTFEGYTDVAIPYVTSLRNQGSRVVGITIGAGATNTYMTRLLGPNLVTAGQNVVVDPQTADVIAIPTEAQIIRTFEQIAQAYCPGKPALSSKEVAQLKEGWQALPKSVATYMGDDELPAQEQPAAAAQPLLDVTKQQIGRCDVNRANQTYDCSYRLSLVNNGTQPYSGTLVLRDEFGAPGVRGAGPVTGNGWSCGTPVDGSMSCIKSGVTLLPGQSDGVEIASTVNGMRNGGQFQNCASMGVSDMRAERVALAQTIMNQRGLDAGPVDGKPGRRTFAALAQLRKSLGLPQGQSFDDDLFRALGVAPQETGKQSCVTVDLPRMPAPPLQCDAATTVPRGESCACRYENMVRRSESACRCAPGYQFSAGQGCSVSEKSKPKPLPASDAADKPRCENGLPRVNGRCPPVQIKPTPRGEGAAGGEKCRVKLNGICIK